MAAHGRAGDATRQARDEFRTLRAHLEEGILSLATSVDGRRFTYQASLHGLELQPGGYVSLSPPGRDPQLGQVLSLAEHRTDGPEIELGFNPDTAPARFRVVIRGAAGDGVILEGDGEPFHDAEIAPASDAEISAWLARVAPTRARLEIGSLLLAPEIPFALDAGGFDRHTFLCGQSGSGKSYALGALLEQVVQETGLRIIILDPNSDFVRFASAKADASEEAASRWRAAASGVVVRQSAEAGDKRLRLRFADLDTRTRAAMLRIDPIADRDEYAALATAVARSRERGGLAAVRELATTNDPIEQQLGLRVGNLGVQEWSVWARDDAGTLLEEIVAGDTRCLVVDLGSLPTREEQALTAVSVLDTLWAQRADRRPTLIVVDEAHNVCPQHPEDGLTALATEHAVRIAGEGRKFGLHLLVATQRPQKVHENVVSQCDNLILMRMNSTADVGALAGAFSFVPPGLLDRATAFRQGETLIAGKLSGHPALVRVGRRISEEGGGDVASGWADTPRG